MIGEEVRRRREELGLTGAQLAARAGMAPSAISQIETGKRSPSSLSVMKLAEALGLEAGDLYPKGQASLFRELSERSSPEEPRSPLSEWAEYARRVADQIRIHTDDPNSDAFRDPYTAQFFVAEKNREAADLYSFFFIEEGRYDDEPLEKEVHSELLSAFEEIIEALTKAEKRADDEDAKARDRADDTVAGRENVSDLDQMRQRKAAAVAKREKVSAGISARREKRGA